MILVATQLAVLRLPRPIVGIEIKRFVVFALLLCSAGVPAHVNSAERAKYQVEQSLEIGKVPADFPVRFSLLTAGPRQYVAYYDEHRRMTVATRALDSNQWQSQVLPSQVGWDSHNSITMAVDRNGQLHLSGNMHCVPLVYFRTEKPGDISTLQKYLMTGRDEDSVTTSRDRPTTT